MSVLWAVRAANLAAALAVGGLIWRERAVVLAGPAAACAVAIGLQIVLTFSYRAWSERQRVWLTVAASVADSAIILWIIFLCGGTTGSLELALLVPAILAALECGALGGALIGTLSAATSSLVLAPAGSALLAATLLWIIFFALAPAAAGLAVPAIRARASASTRRTLARLRSAQIGEYLSFVTFQLSDYCVTLSSIAQAMTLCAPNHDAKTLAQAEKLKHASGELSAKISRLLGDKSALTATHPPTQTAVDLAAMARELAAEATQAFAPSGVRVDVLTQGEIPLVRSDRRSIELALLSVLQNSLEACSSRGGGAVTIFLRREAGNAEIEVADDGGGVPEMIKPQVFEPFVSSRFGTHALGLGLSMSRRFLERIGGSLRLKSKGGYTAALLEIPIDAELPKIRNEESTWAGRRA